MVKAQQLHLRRVFDCIASGRLGPLQKHIAIMAVVTGVHDAHHGVLFLTRIRLHYSRYRVVCSGVDLATRHARLLTEWAAVRVRFSVHPVLFHVLVVVDCDIFSDGARLLSHAT